MKRLYRIKGNDKMLGGVAAGLSEYFDIDVTILRVLFAIGFFSPFPTVITYLILWIVMPSKESIQFTNSKIVTS